MPSAWRVPWTVDWPYRTFFRKRHCFRWQTHNPRSGMYERTGSDIRKGRAYSRDDAIEQASRAAREIAAELNRNPDHRHIARGEET